MTELTLHPVANQKAGQMTWRLPGQSQPMLHLRLKPSDPWQAYTNCPQHMVPDPSFLSAGYATFFHLLKQDWEVVI
jgi:hypothetical protein